MIAKSFTQRSELVAEGTAGNLVELLVVIDRTISRGEGPCAAREGRRGGAGAQHAEPRRSILTIARPDNASIYRTDRFDLDR